MFFNNIFIVSTLLHTVNALITNCDIPPAICPQTLQGETRCPITNETILSSLGITSFNASNISDKQFTWTVGYRETTGSEVALEPNLDDGEVVPESGEEEDDLLALTAPPPPPPLEPGSERSYYLGVPGAWLGKGVSPVVSVKTKSDSPEEDDTANPEVRVDGCALFFEGASQYLQFPGDDVSTSNGVCSDVLGVGCSADLIELARNEFAKLTKIEVPRVAVDSTAKNSTRSSNFNSYNVCHFLGAKLRDAPPESCLNALGEKKSWGAITARSRVLSRYTPIDPPSPETVLNPVSSLPLFDNTGQPVCHPTTADTSYAILPIFQSFTPKSNKGITEEQVKYGVTPILTLWYTNSTVQVEVPIRTTSGGKTVLRKRKEMRHNVTMVEGGVQCLKPVGTRRLTTSSNDFKGGAARVMGGVMWGWSFAVTVAAIMML